jgi:hypothetical protein
MWNLLFLFFYIFFFFHFILRITVTCFVFIAMKSVVDGTWGTWNPIWMLGHGLDGATVGIVGLGRIGSAVAKCLRENSTLARNLN